MHALSRIGLDVANRPSNSSRCSRCRPQGGGRVAALEGPHQLLEGRPDQVGGHADHADPADGEQRQQVLVVARVLLQLAAGLAVQAAGRGHVADRVLDRDHVVQPLEQPDHGRHLDGAGGPPGML
jgi:hypothetical protein